MAIRKSAEESVVVSGPRDEWIARCLDALRGQGFTKVEANENLKQITANYKKATTWGNIVLTLTPEGTDTRIHSRATANIDNIYALFRSPTRKILDTFKAGLK